MEEELNEIITIIQSHRDKTYRKINEELVLMYFEIGKYLSIKIKSEKRGSKTVENISRKIMELYPNLGVSIKEDYTGWYSFMKHMDTM